ncbi:MAG: hypothetical protein FWG30_11115 [Eubacteriaceae bacterium]|nr:hypothetical protein [Eubacteriaceae bacterium]
MDKENSKEKAGRKLSSLMKDFKDTDKKKVQKKPMADIKSNQNLKQKKPSR